jgi:hypothetical protein
MDAHEGDLRLQRWILVRQAVGPENQAKDFLHGNKQADGGNQGHVRGLIQNGLIAEAIDKHAPDADNDSRQEHAQGQVSGGIGDQQSQVGAQGEKAGMGHVQNAQQTVYQRQSDGDDGIHATVYQPLNEQFQVEHESNSYFLLPNPGEPEPNSFSLPNLEINRMRFAGMLE